MLCSACTSSEWAYGIRSRGFTIFPTPLALVFLLFEEPIGDYESFSKAADSSPAVVQSIQEANRTREGIVT